MKEIQKKLSQELRQATDTLIMCTEEHEKCIIRTEYAATRKANAEHTLRSLQQKLVMEYVFTDKPKCPECLGHGCEVCKS